MDDPATLAPAADATGRYRWPAGARLARDLATLVDCRGAVVCELGCGQAALALAALAAGAAEAHACDGDPAVIAALAPQPRLHPHVHAWGDPPPVPPATLVLCGDCLYRPSYQEALLRSIALALAPTGEALLSDPRTRLEEPLPALAAAAGLTWEPVRLPDYTCIRCRRRSATAGGPRLR